MPCALTATAATQSMAPAARAIASFFMSVPPDLLGLPGATNRAGRRSGSNSTLGDVDLPILARRFGARELLPSTSLDDSRNTADDGSGDRRRRIWARSSHNSGGGASANIGPVRLDQHHQRRNAVPLRHRVS